MEDRPLRAGRGSGFAVAFAFICACSCLLDPTAALADDEKPVRIGAGYYGDSITHPGGYFITTWEVARAGGFSVLVGLDVGAYNHPRNHTGLFVRSIWASRYTAPFGLLVEPRFTLGYLHTWVGGDEYWVVDRNTGEAWERNTPAGSPNGMYGFGVGLGWEAQKGPIEGLAFIARFDVLARAPFNGYALTQYAGLLGFEWKLRRRRR